METAGAAVNRALAKILRVLGLIAYASSGFGITVLAVGLYDVISSGHLHVTRSALPGLLVFAGLTIGVPLALGVACRFTAGLVEERLRVGA